MGIMTAKRFELNNIVKKGTVSFWDNKKQKILNASHVLDELNRLNDKNEQLKKKNKELEYHLNNTEKELQEYKDFMSLG